MSPETENATVDADQKLIEEKIESLQSTFGASKIEFKALESGETEIILSNDTEEIVRGTLSELEDKAVELKEAIQDQRASDLPSAAPSGDI